MTYVPEVFEPQSERIVWVVNNGARNIKIFPENKLEEAVALMLTCKKEGIVEQLNNFRFSYDSHYVQYEPTVVPKRVTRRRYDEMFEELEMTRPTPPPPPPTTRNVRGDVNPPRPSPLPPRPSRPAR